jgi:hypothetical protein
MRDRFLYGAGFINLSVNWRGRKGLRRGRFPAHRFAHPGRSVRRDSRRRGHLGRGAAVSRRCAL